MPFRCGTERHGGRSLQRDDHPGSTTERHGGRSLQRDDHPGSTRNGTEAVPCSATITRARRRNGTEAVPCSQNRHPDSPQLSPAGARPSMRRLSLLLLGLEHLAAARVDHPGRRSARPFARPSTPCWPGSGSGPSARRWSLPAAAPRRPLLTASRTRPSSSSRAAGTCSARSAARSGSGRSSTARSRTGRTPTRRRRTS